MKTVRGYPLTQGKGKPSKSAVTRWLLTENILCRHFEKYIHDMDLKLTEHVRSTISLLFKQKLGENRYLEHF